MKQIKIFSLFFLLIPMLATANIYKIIQPNGVVSYSDKFHKNAEIIEVAEGSKFNSMTQKVTISDANDNTLDKNDQKEQTSNDKLSYEKVKFATPTNKQTFWNQRQIPVALAITPRLQEGDQVQIYIDGNPQPPQPTHKFVLNGIPRGEHKLKAAILDSKGNKLKESAELVIYVHFASKKQSHSAESTPTKVVNKLLPKLFR